MKLNLSIKIIGLVIVVVGSGLAYVRAFTIAAASMSPTFWVGDFIVSNHAAYDLRLPYMDRVLLETGAPQAGDLIMYFDIPKSVIATKRIVGVPGDTVRMENNVLYINDIAVKQREISRKLFGTVPAQHGLGDVVMLEALDTTGHLITYTPGKSPVHSFADVKVTEGKYFILGDHRDNSADSRYIGLISRDQIKGKVIRGARTLDAYAHRP